MRSNRCVICHCRDVGKLHQHHIKYLPSETITLCASCHGIIHRFLNPYDLNRVDWRKLEHTSELKQIQKFKDCANYRRIKMRVSKGAVKRLLEEAVKKSIRTVDQEGASSKLGQGKIQIKRKLWDIQDIVDIFLLYLSSWKNTTITSVNKGAYTTKELKLDLKQNLGLLFPTLDDASFRNFWARFDLNFLLRRFWKAESEIIYGKFKNKIQDFILGKIRELSDQKKDLVKNFLEISPEIKQMFTKTYTGDDADLFIRIGLLFQGRYFDSKGDFKGNEYYYPGYLDEVKSFLTESM